MTNLCQKRSKNAVFDPLHDIWSAYCPKHVSDVKIMFSRSSKSILTPCRFSKNEKSPSFFFPMGEFRQKDQRLVWDSRKKTGRSKKRPFLTCQISSKGSQTS